MQTEDSSSRELRISIVIPSYNRAHMLKRVLNALLEQSIPREDYEIILVDNASNDDTSNLVRDYQQRFSNMRYFYEEDRGVAPSRNKGLYYAQADIVLFLDDDMIADRFLLEEHLKAHEYHSGSVLGFFETDWEGHEDPFLRYLERSGVQNAFPFQDGDIVPYQYFYTGNISVKKSFVQKVGGFDEEFPCYGVEDIDLGYRMSCYGDKILFHKKALSLHDYHPDYRSFKRKRGLAGRSLRYFLRKFPHLKYSFHFGAGAPYSLYVLKTFFTLLSPAMPVSGLVSGNISKWIRYGYYHWNIRWEMYKQYRTSVKKPFLS